MSLKELLSQTGGKSAKFENPGDTITGTVVATDVRQTRNFQTGDPETWDDGNPKQQVVITLQTADRDASDPDDDGQRSVFCKWWGLQRQALQQAVRASGADDIVVGGTFTATYTGDGEQKQRGFNPPKLYTYSYTPPSATAGLLTGAAPAETPAAATPPPAEPAQAPAPAAPPADPAAALDTIKTLIKSGLTDQQIAAAIPAFPLDAIVAVRSTLAAA